MSNPTLLLGAQRRVHRLGFGAMRLCGQPGNFGPYPDWEAGKALLRKALEAGVDFIDTAHAYGPGWNETLIGEVLAETGSNAWVATKGGVEKTAPDKVFPDGRPAQLRLRCEESLRRLQLETLPLYQLHRPDPAVPFEESVGALAALQAEGKILHVGLSNVSVAQIESARAILPIVSVQNRYNLTERADQPVLEYCRAHAIAYIPWGPLAAKPFAPEAPLARETRLESIARTHGATPGQVALAWLLHTSPNTLLIPGTTNAQHLAENLAAARLTLSTEELSALDALDALKSGSS